MFILLGMLTMLNIDLIVVILQSALLIPSKYNKHVTAIKTNYIWFVSKEDSVKGGGLKSSWGN